MKIHSKNRYSERLTISSGASKLTLTVDLDLSTAAQRLRKAREVLAQAQIDALKDPSPEHVAAFGQGIRLLVETVFGKEQTNRILVFYEDRAEALLDDLMPYILNRIAPIVARHSAARRKELERKNRWGRRT